MVAMGISNGYRNNYVIKENGATYNMYSWNYVCHVPESRFASSCSDFVHR